MDWIVKGAWKDSGKEGAIVVDAGTRAQAEYIAADRGLFVEDAELRESQSVARPLYVGTMILAILFALAGIGAIIAGTVIRTAGADPLPPSGNYDVVRQAMAADAARVTYGYTLYVVAGLFFFCAAVLYQLREISMSVYRA